MSLTVYTGPMMSQKTTHMLRRITQIADATHLKVLIVNHSLDTRDEKLGVSSHSSQYKGVSDKVTVVRASRLAEVDVADFQVIGIDEANFFPDLFELVSRWVKEGKSLVCAGLDGNFRMEKFGDIASLLPIADEFVKLCALCTICTKELAARGETITLQNLVPAPFTDKIGGDRNAVIDIGANDKYAAVCRRHHTFGRS